MKRDYNPPTTLPPQGRAPEALNLLKENIKNQNLVKHSLAVGEAMKSLAEYFREDTQKWEVCGLLHDIDYEKTKEDPNSHSKIGAEMLQNLGLEKEIYDAVLTHNETHGILPETKMAKALYCVDPLTGLIVAATLVLPSKKINGEWKIFNLKEVKKFFLS